MIDWLDLEAFLREHYVISKDRGTEYVVIPIPKLVKELTRHVEYILDTTDDSQEIPF
jgi:hypothetical protein